MDQFTDICFHADRHEVIYIIPGSNIECQKNIWEFKICRKLYTWITLELRRKHDYYDDDEEKGKVVAFKMVMTKEMASKLETKVIIKVSAHSEFLQSISLRKFEDYDFEDGDVVRFLIQDRNDDELMFHDGPFEIEATITSPSQIMGTT